MKYEKVGRFIFLFFVLIATMLLLSACGVSPEDMGREAGKALKDFTESLLKGFQEGCCGGSIALVLPSIAIVFRQIKKN
jgi:hypothetical protein